jgi:hypothetical protein
MRCYIAPLDQAHKPLGPSPLSQAKPLWGFPLSWSVVARRRKAESGGEWGKKEAGRSTASPPMHRELFDGAAPRVVWGNRAVTPSRGRRSKAGISLS